MASHPEEHAGSEHWRGVLTDLPPRDGAAGPARSGLTPLADRAWLRVTGGDARAFLHGQVSADLLSLGTNRLQPAAYCSPQGRVIAIPRFLREGESWLLELPASMAEPVARRLRMFVLRADARIEVARDVAAFGAWGSEARDALVAAGSKLPRDVFACEVCGETSVTRMPGDTPRLQLTGPADAVVPAFERIAESLAPSRIEAWQLLDIEAGLADVGPETTDRHLPQSLALDAWDAVNYRKGCYPGQEVIARLHYRGRLKRRLHRAGAKGAPPRPGTRIVDSAGAVQGEVVSAASAADGETRLLAVLKDIAGERRYRVEATGAQLTSVELIKGTNPVPG